MQTRSRYWVVAGLFVLSLITYIDRAAISSVKEPVAAELALDDRQMGVVFSVFALGYALGQVPSGWFADKAGPRAMLSIVVALWSLLTGWTGRASSFASLVTIRFLFGVAEAGAFPGMARAFFTWLPASERGRANGIVFSGARIGAAVAFPAMAILVTNLGWRETFYWLAVPGLLWAAVWMVLFRDRPSAGEVGQAPGKTEGVPVWQALRLPSMQRAMLQYFGANFTTFFCLSWMNPYLKQRYGLTVSEAAFYTMIPLLIGAGSQWATGFLVDFLYASNRQSISRSAPAAIGFLISAVGACAIPFAPNAATATACFALAAFGAEMTISPSWAFCMDLGGCHSGAVGGAMNTAGNLGSFVSSNAFPWLQSVTGGSAAFFGLVCILNLIGVWCWRGMKVQSSKTVNVD